MTEILDTSAPEFTGLDRVSVKIGDSTLVCAFDEWAPVEPGGPTEVDATFTWRGVDDLEVPLDQADEMVAELRGFVDRVAATVASIRIYRQMAELGQVPLLGTLINALRSPDPVASLEWLVSVETDEETRHGLTAALDALRAREGGARD